MSASAAKPNSDTGCKESVMSDRLQVIHFKSYLRPHHWLAPGSLRRERIQRIAGAPGVAIGHAAGIRIVRTIELECRVRVGYRHAESRVSNGVVYQTGVYTCSC